MKKLIAMMLIILSVFFFACNKDEEKTFSPDEVRMELNQLGAEMSNYTDQMKNADGIDAFNTLIQLTDEKDPFTLQSKSFVKTKVIGNISNYLLPVQPNSVKSITEPTPFNFDQHLGTYTFHFDSIHPTWIVVSGGDKIIINFPTDTLHKDVNDGKLTISAYTESLIDGEYMPTRIIADLTIDGTKYVDIDLTAAWGLDGEPTSFDIHVYLIPFEFTGEFSKTSTSTSIVFAIHHGTTQIFSSGFGILFTTATDSIPAAIDGYIQMLRVKVHASVDIKDIADIFMSLEAAPFTSHEEILAAINNEINAYLTIDGIKAADIKIAFKAPTPTDDFPIDIIFVYSDGSKESAKQYIDSFSEDFDMFFDFLDDYYSEW